MEILRRLVFLSCLVAALWVWLVPLPERVSLSVHDFAEAQRRRPGWDDDRGLPLEEFIQRKTEDRLEHVSGERWAALADALSRIDRGESLPAGVPGQGGTRHRSNSLFLAPTELPPSGRPVLVSERHPFVYLRLDDSSRPWLTATHIQGDDAAGISPAAIFHPHRHLAPWLFFGGLLAYLLLPRPGRQADTIRCRPAAAVILPDLVGLILFGGIFGLSLLLASQMGSTGSPLDGDWLVPTLVLWAFSLFGLVIFAIAAWYGALRFRLREDRVQRITLFGSSERRYDEIVAAEPAVKRPPKFLRVLGPLVGLLNWRAYGPVLLATSRNEHILDVCFRDGQKWRVSLDAIEEPERLIQALSPRLSGQG